MGPISNKSGGFNPVTSNYSCCPRRDLPAPHYQSFCFHTWELSFSGASPHVWCWCKRRPGCVCAGAIAAPDDKIHCCKPTPSSILHTEQERENIQSTCLCWYGISFKSISVTAQIPCACWRRNDLLTIHSAYQRILLLSTILHPLSPIHAPAAANIVSLCALRIFNSKAADVSVFPWFAIAGCGFVHDAFRAPTSIFTYPVISRTGRRRINTDAPLAS